MSWKGFYRLSVIKPNSAWPDLGYCGDIQVFRNYFSHLLSLSENPKIPRKVFLLIQFEFLLKLYTLFWQKMAFFKRIILPWILHLEFKNHTTSLVKPQNLELLKKNLVFHPQTFWPHQKLRIDRWGKVPWWFYIVFSVSFFEENDSILQKLFYSSKKK